MHAFQIKKKCWTLYRSRDNELRSLNLSAENKLTSFLCVFYFPSTAEKEFLSARPLRYATIGMRFFFQMHRLQTYTHKLIHNEMNNSNIYRYCVMFRRRHTSFSAHFIRQFMFSLLTSVKPPKLHGATGLAAFSAAVFVNFLLCDFLNWVRPMACRLNASFSILLAYNAFGSGLYCLSLRS